MSADPGLRVATDARGVATVTLDRAARHNAFDDALVAALRGAFEALGADPAVRAVVLESTGRSFSAGADLEWMRRAAAHSEAENVADAEGLAAMLRALDRLPRPVLALVQGPAYGGGVGLVACCDVVVASERAEFRLTEVRLGLTPATIAPYVVRAIGARQARRWFATAEAIPAARALAIGLVHEVVAPDALAGAGAEVLAALLAGAPGAQADAKALVHLCADRDGDPDLGAETARRIAARRGSPEGREGIAAFLGRRPPAWRPAVPAPEPGKPS